VPILTVDYTGTWIRILEISIIRLFDSHNHFVNYDPIPLYFLTKALVSIPFESGSNKKQTKVLRVYFNNHYGGKAVINALQFKAMTGHSLSEIETNVLERAEKYLSTCGLITSSSVYPS
jgi:hypothetical protein